MARRAIARKGPQQDVGGSADAFLSVTASARGFAWRERLETGAANIAIAISQRHGVPELLGRVLAARGIGLDEVPDVLAPTIKALMPDPSTLVDMDKAAARLADAVQKRERVAVFGDYDVDGACSSALMRRFFLAHDLDATIYIPDRMFEGYGPNIPAIKSLVEKGAQLIVTVDCGTTSFEPLAPAHRPGVDVLVVDHHQADERLPDVAAVVNPNRQDDLSGLGHLCAAGVVFMLLVATARELRTRGHYSAAVTPPDLIGMLDLVALATVCDVVPLKSLNRAYVTRGLEVMRQRRNVGLRALIDAAGINQPPTPYVLGFVLGPRINAGGRIWMTRRKRRALPFNSTSSTASARPSRRRCWRKPSPKPTGWSTRRRICRCWWSRPSAGTRAWSGWWRAGSSSGSVVPRVSSPGKKADRARDRSARSPMSISARRCGRQRWTACC